MKNTGMSLVRALAWAWFAIGVLALSGCSSGGSEEVSAVTSHLTKGQVGAVNGQSDYQGQTGSSVFGSQLSPKNEYCQRALRCHLLLG